MKLGRTSSTLGRFTTADHVDHLILWMPLEVLYEVKTSQGTKDRVVVADLFCDTCGLHYKDVRLFGQVLVEQLADHVDEAVPGRLTQPNRAYVIDDEQGPDVVAELFTAAGITRDEPEQSEPPF